MDTLDLKILKLGKNLIAQAITHIPNLSISTKTFPQAWKVAIVIPLHKKKDTLSPENPRLVSLLSTTSKVLERAIYLLNFLKVQQNIAARHIIKASMVNKLQSLALTLAHACAWSVAAQ